MPDTQQEILPCNWAIHPIPDDAFMFYGLGEGQVPHRALPVSNMSCKTSKPLSHRARSGELEITAISIHAYPYVADKYALTSCGSSMGDNYGPMVIARESHWNWKQLRGKTIAIPGELTTAFLTLQLCLGKGMKKGAGASSDAGAVIKGTVPL